MGKPVQACYWIIGAETGTPAVALDLLDADGNLVGETQIFPLCDYITEQLEGRIEIHYDPDSTETYRRD